MQGIETCLPWALAGCQTGNLWHVGGHQACMAWSMRGSLLFCARLKFTLEFSTPCQLSIGRGTEIEIAEFLMLSDTANVTNRLTKSWNWFVIDSRENVVRMTWIWKLGQIKDFCKSWWLIQSFLLLAPKVSLVGWASWLSVERSISIRCHIFHSPSDSCS